MPTAPSKKREAARIYQQTRNISETARKAGVHRVTVTRWLKEPGFLDVLQEETQPGTVGIDDLVDKSLRLLNNALDGDKVTSAQIRAALEVVKSSNALKKPLTSENQGESLADLISKLDTAEDAELGD